MSLSASVAGSGYQQFVFDEAGHLAGEYDAQGAMVAEYVWLGDTPIAVLKPLAVSNPQGGQVVGSIAVFFIQPDELDTPRTIVNSTGTVVWDWESAPFGEATPNGNPSGLGQFDFRLRFPGQMHDSVTGTNYNYFRDFVPTEGRYLQPDPIGLLGGSPSTFAYSDSDPVDFFDADGLRRGRGSRGGRDGHHWWPKFLGGAKKQPLAYMCQCEHVQLHIDLNQHLGTYVDPVTGRNMWPRKGNSGADIRSAFTPKQIECALDDFYSGKGSRYRAAASMWKRRKSRGGGGSCGCGGGSK